MLSKQLLRRIAVVGMRSKPPSLPYAVYGQMWNRRFSTHNKLSIPISSELSVVAAAKKSEDEDDDRVVAVLAIAAAAIAFGVY